MDKNADKIDLLILGGSSSSRKGSSSAGSVRSSNLISADVSARNANESEAPIALWFDRILEKLEQYSSEFNRATEEGIVIKTTRSVVNELVRCDFDAGPVVLQICERENAISFFLKFEESSSFDLIAEFVNTSNTFSPKALRYDSSDVTFKSLPEALRGIFGFFIEATVEAFEKMAVGKRSQKRSEPAGECEVDNDKTSALAEDFSMSPLSSLLSETAPVNKRIGSDENSLSNIFDAGIPEPTSKDNGMTHNDDGDLSMLQTRESSLIEAFDNVRQSVERELSECSKNGAKAFESRDMQAVQGAAARLEKVQNLKERINSNLNDWVRELSE